MFQSSSSKLIFCEPDSSYPSELMFIKLLSCVFDVLLSKLALSSKLAYDGLRFTLCMKNSSQISISYP